MTGVRVRGEEMRVSMLREALGRRADDGDPAQSGTRARRAAGRLRSALAGLGGLAGRHRLFSVVLGLAVLAYMSWFAAVDGAFNLTNSNGLFLWSRTMSFASCATIKPPPDLAALCPARQPGAMAQPVASKRLLPKQYLWD